jgi:hypothetical protein
MDMNFNRRKRSAFLDEVRVKRGNSALVESFRNTVEANREQALEHLNDAHLCFPSLYVLREEIAKAHLFDQLCDRDCEALDFLNIRNSGKDKKAEIETHPGTLKWMIKTGGQDNIDSDYLKKLDTAAAFLVSVHGDRSMLPVIVEMTFYRCRNGLPYHDLIWAILESRDPYILTLVAGRLVSSDNRERDCAYKLLGFIPGIDKKQTFDGGKHYEIFCEWIEENGPFLWYKGETFDTIHTPTPYVLMPAAKYLGTFVNVNDGKPLMELSKKQRRLLRNFGDLPKASQVLLASYSTKKRANNRDQWLEWMNLPIKKQLEEAQGRDHHD